MEVFAAVEADIIALFLIGVMVFYGRIRERNWREKNVFTQLLMANGLLCITDILSWGMEGATFPGAYWVLQLSTLFYNISLVLIGALWLIYCDNQILGRRKKSKARQMFYIFPLLLVVCVNVINIWTGWIFYYDAENVYHRGEYYVIHIAAAVMYIIMAVGLVVIGAGGQEKAKARESHALLGFVVAPAVTIGIQAIHYGVSLIPFGISLSLLMIFLQRIIGMITKDHLTGLDNRRVFEQKLEEKVRNASDEEALFVMMIDADYFKAINDTYGHDIGDEALIRIANSMRRVAAEGDYLARLGGDEFVMIGTRSSEEEIEDLDWSLHAQLEEESKKAGYLLTVSTGYEVYHYRKYKTGAELYKKADEKMYANKREYHLTAHRG